MLQKVGCSFYYISLQLELIYCLVRWGENVQGSSWINIPLQEKHSCSVKVISLYSASIRVILSATYRRTLINGPAAGGTTLAASTQPLIPYFSGLYD